jgi:hypothetical protein
MLRFRLFVFCVLILISLRASGATYTLVDGSKISGEPISQNDSGVIFKTDNDVDLGRVEWDKFTQQALKQLLEQAKTPRERSLIESLIDDQETVKRKEIVVTPVQTPERPTTGLGLAAIFASPVGLFILLVLYCGNLFAAYEVALYRRQPAGTVCGLAAIPFLGILSTIFYLASPTRVILIDGQAPLEPTVRFQETPPPSSAPRPDEPLHAEVVEDSIPVQQTVTAPVLPDTIVYKKGDFFFNRRFFETKLAGFFRVVPNDNQKDMVVQINSGRGNFVGRRITRITPAELYLQVFKDNATADEMIPFVEIVEVQVRHKDSA